MTTKTSSRRCRTEEHHMNRPSPARIVVAASSLALVGLTVIAPDVGAATGSYSATVAFYDGTGHRTAVVAGTPVEAVIALKNTSTGTTPASLGSANITLPT